MKILITGANGFAGKNLICYLSNLGHEIFGTFREDDATNLLLNSKITWVKVDIGKELIELGPVDVIIHTAAVHEFSRKSPNCMEYVNSNIQSTVNLAEFAKKCYVKLFIYLSSIAVHGRVTTPILSEESPLFQPNIYGVSKYMSECVLERYKGIFPSVILRLPGLVGPKCDQRRPLIATILQKALKHQDISIYNKSSVFNNITDVFDLGRVISVLIDQKFYKFEVFNLATCKPIQLIEVVKQIINVCKSKSIIVEEYTSHQSFHLNINRLLQNTTFKPKSTESLIDNFVFDNIKQF